MAKRFQRVAAPSKTNLPLIEEQDARGEVAECYEYFRSRFGRPEVPGILKCFATHPPLLRHMIELAEPLLFTDGALSRRQKEMIATFVSSLNDCSYCADSHGFFLSVQGGDAQTIRGLLQGDLSAAGLDTSERALLEFARKLNENSPPVDREEVQALRRTGWSEQQIAEAIHLTALFAFFNRVANAFGLKPQGLLSGESKDILTGSVCLEGNQKGTGK